MSDDVGEAPGFRMVAAEDEDGALFTADELRAALRQAYTDPADYAEMPPFTDEDIENPGHAWTEPLGFLIAFIHPHRAERLRRKMGYSPQEFEDRVQALGRTLPW